MKYYKRIDSKGNTITVESYSHNSPVVGAIEIGKSEYDAYIANLPAAIKEVIRDLGKELDELKAELRVKAII